jgi:site-specific DNA recombinase
MMPVGVYLRVSTEEQRERQSIETQREFAQRFCNFHSLTICEIYADDGVSGTIPIDRRPEASRAMHDARLKKFDQLLVYRLDRLGRDTRLTLDAVAELEKCGVRIRSMTEEFDTATASGKLMLTMLSGFAAHEHAVIRERSVAGTNRVVTGAWMGGIVPYGYRKDGEKAKARLVISEELVPGLEMSEAEVIRTIFKMAAVEKKSCQVISDYLNRIGVPCAYSRDERLIARGKRQIRTSGIWRPGRVRNLLISSTYVGKHQWGKRSRTKNREIITREVPAIVSEDIWQRAQLTLKSNFIFGKRNTRQNYLLRGMIKCSLCNLTYIGMTAHRPSGKVESYYRCNGKHGTRGLFGEQGQRCPSKDVNGSFLETTIWADIESFLRNPGAVIEQLQKRIAAERNDAKPIKDRLTKLQGALYEKITERDRMFGLFRKGRIQEDALNVQMDQIDREEAALKARIDDLSTQLRGTEAGAARLGSAGALLAKLRARLDEPISWELKRQLVEVLVGGVRVDTFQENGKRCAAVTVTYRLASTVDTCTDRGSWRRPA